MSNRRNIQFMYSPHNKATVLDCSFVVDPTNGNGLGARSMKDSGRIAKVFMNSTASFIGSTHSNTTIDAIPGGTGSLVVGMPIQGSGIPVGTVIASIVNSGSITISQAATTSVAGGTITYQGVGSPNPAAGLIVVQLQDNYNKYLGGYSGFVAPVSGTPILVAGAGVSVGTAYVIVSLGTTTQSGWQSLGLPAGIQAAVGVSFIANVTGTAAGTGAVEAIAAGYSGIDHIEVIGDPNLMNNSLGATVLGQGLGMTIILACLKDTVLTAPAAGTVIGMNFYMNDSAQGV